METEKTFQTLINEVDAKFGGILLCDPNRLYDYIGYESRGSDLSDFFSEEFHRICNNGIGITVDMIDMFGSTVKVIIRHINAQKFLKSEPQKISRGWVLGTETGKLVLCDYSSLLFWDPWEDEEFPPRYIHLSIPSGWYEVEINIGTDCEDDDEMDILELILNPVEKRPRFSPDFLNEKSNLHNKADNFPEISFPVLNSEKNFHENSDGVEVLRLLLSRLNKKAFINFVIKLFGNDYRDINPLYKAGKDVYFSPLLDSYGDSLHSVFLLQYLPAGILENPNLTSLLNEPLFNSKLKRLKYLYKGEAGYFGMVSELAIKAQKLQILSLVFNFCMHPCEYKSVLFEVLEKKLVEIDFFPPKFQIGSYDSFLELNAKETSDTFKEFLVNNSDGISISIERDKLEVRNFTYENSLEGGILPINKQPVEPIFITKLKKKAQAILEFEYLLKRNAKENELEKFLAAHYKEIFGSKYDRIETQLWLRFPELDISGKNRRIDILLRNSIQNDWELFEIKRIIPLTGIYRDVPVIAREVSYAVHQLRNYERILRQKDVMDKFARNGIEYFEPSLNLVIGSSPQITHEQWRWLLALNSERVKIHTFDELLDEMRIRLTDKLNFLCGDDD